MRRKENHSNGYSAKILTSSLKRCGGTLKVSSMKMIRSTPGIRITESRCARTWSASTVFHGPAVVGYEQKAQENGQPDAVRIWIVRLGTGTPIRSPVGGTAHSASTRG